MGLHSLVLLLPEDDTPVPKHVGVLIIIMNYILLSAPPRPPPPPMSVQQNELAYQ